MHLIFVDDAVAVDHAGKEGLGTHATLVAVTAEAVRRLDELSLEHVPVCEVADSGALPTLDRPVTRAVAGIARAAEGYIGHRSRSLRTEGPGILAAQSYQLSFALQAIVTRTFLMRAAIEKLAPTRVTVIENGIDRWFSSDDYPANPWVGSLSELVHRKGVDTQIVVQPAVRKIGNGKPESSRTTGWLQWARRAARRQVDFWPAARRARRLVGPEHAAALEGIRLLFVDGAAYDWDAVRPALTRLPNFSGCSVCGEAIQGRGWADRFAPRLEFMDRRHPQTFDIPPPEEADGGGEAVALLDEWIRSEKPRLELLDSDFLPALLPHLREMVRAGPGLVRHADAVADHALAAARPEATCFVSIHTLSRIRFAVRSRLRSVPTVSYQHGGSFGTHDLAQYRLTDAAHADYLLTYGPGIAPPTGLTLRATPLPVGSARVERMQRSRALTRRRAGRRRVLWVTEVARGNTIGGTFLLEDTRRYAIERSCLSTLATAPGLEVTYRPHPGQAARSGTVSWLRSTFGSAVRVDGHTPLESLMRRSDLVIVLASGGTTWNEALALGRPLIVFCNPHQAHLLPRFAADLEGAAHWSRSSDDILATVERAVGDWPGLLADIRSKDPTAFLRRYVLHSEDGRCVDRVLQALSTIRSRDLERAS